MMDIVRHRGPDDEGMALFDNQFAPILLGGEDTPAELYETHLPYTPKTADKHDVSMRLGLGHRRLSIVDISSHGHQPMSDEEGNNWIIYNGEIYNYIELKMELTSRGYSFNSLTDTEVLLAAYKEWGRDCLHRLNGMFAFIIYNMDSSTIFVARDRFGIKPLYYWVSPDGFIGFASEIKQFTVLPGWNPVINSRRVYDFLNFGFIDHTKETMFNGVYQLRGGEMAEFQLDDSLSFRPYTEIPVESWYTLSSKTNAISFEEATDQFRFLISDSVRLRLRADVPVGSCLSGGLDSSTIVCLLHEILKHGSNSEVKQHTYSSCSQYEEFDERRFIETVVSHTGVNGHYVYPDGAELFRQLDKLTWHQDEPFGSTGIFAQWMVFAIASADNMKVMLDGQGADEQLGGYQTYYSSRMASLLKAFHWKELYKEVKCAHELRNYKVYDALKDTARVIASAFLSKTFYKRLKFALVGSNFINWQELEVNTDEMQFVSDQSNDSIYKRSYAQLTSTMLQKLLHWEDRDSMAHSIESRVPFMDHRLVEFTLGLPDHYKLYHGVTKRVLRESTINILPEEIRNRMDKLGFATPESIWARETNSILFKSELEKAINMSNGIVNPKILNYFDYMLAGKKSYDSIIWRIISFGTWLNRFRITI